MTERQPEPNISPATEQSKNRNRMRWALRGGVIAVVLGLSVWYVVGNIDWKGLQQAILSMNPVWVIGGVLSTLAAHMARAQRWRNLIPGGSSILLINSFSATIIGYMMNNLIPRSGELVRPYVLSRREKKPATALLASILVERVLDGLTLAFIFVLLLFFESQRLDQVFTGYSSRSIIMSLLVPIAVVVAGLIVLLKTSIGERITGSVERRLPAKFKGKLQRLLHDFRTGIGFGGPVGIMKILFGTAAIWFGYVFACYCGMLAFGFDATYGMGLIDALMVLAITAVGVSIAPTPGAFGVYHGFCKAALMTLFGVPAESAVAFALVTHAGQYLAVMVVAPFFLLRENLSLREMSRPGVDSVPDNSLGTTAK